MGRTVSEEERQLRVTKITLGQLLVIDPEAYVNLCLRYPHGASSYEEIQALKLPEGHIAAADSTGNIFLAIKDPPALLRFDKKKLEWVPFS